MRRFESEICARSTAQHFQKYPGEYNYLAIKRQLEELGLPEAV